MISNIILAVIVLWAVGFAGIKSYRIYKQAKHGKSIGCSCSGCPGCGAAKKC